MLPLRPLCLPLLCLVLSYSAPVLVIAQSVNPYIGNTGATRVGGALYGARCATCHGADAKGIVAPDLTRLWAIGVEDHRIFQIIKEGVPGSIMPPSAAPDNELWAIVAYLRDISTVSLGMLRLSPR
jgi:mono/diheme cytochrome c family protein